MLSSAEISEQRICHRTQFTMERISTTQTCALHQRSNNLPPAVLRECILVVDSRTPASNKLSVSQWICCKVSAAQGLVSPMIALIILQCGLENPYQYDNPTCNGEDCLHDFCEVCKWIWGCYGWRKSAWAVSKSLIMVEQELTNTVTPAWLCWKQTINLPLVATYILFGLVRSLDHFIYGHLQSSNFWLVLKVVLL